MNTLMLENPHKKIKVTGLPRFEKIPDVKKSQVKTNNILFLEQPTFPSTEIDRYDLVNKLIALGNEYPNKKIIIKPRFAELTGHAHRPKFLLQDIIKKFTVPDNVIIQYDNIYTIFQNIDLALTISSTAGLEALMLGIPTYFIDDYCKSINKFGSDYFKDLNAVISFSDVFNNNYPDINYNKVNDYIDYNNSSGKIIAEEILKL